MACNGVLGETAGCAAPIALLPACVLTGRVLCDPHLAWVHLPRSPSPIGCGRPSPVLGESGLAPWRNCKWGGSGPWFRTLVREALVVAAPGPHGPAPKKGLMLGSDTEGTCRALLCGWILHLHRDQHGGTRCALPACSLCSQARCENGVCLHTLPLNPQLWTEGGS